MSLSQTYHGDVRQRQIGHQLRSVLLRKQFEALLGILLLTVPITLWIGWFQVGSSLRRRLDIRDAPVQRAPGIITWVSPSKQGRLIQVRVRNTDRFVPDEACALVQRGEKVIVEYQVGKSGITYVVRVLTPDIKAK